MISNHQTAVRHPSSLGCLSGLISIITTLVLFLLQPFGRIPKYQYPGKNQQQCKDQYDLTLPAKQLPNLSFNFIYYHIKPSLSCCFKGLGCNYIPVLIVFLLLWLWPVHNSYASSLCKGHFVNPITDIDWNGLFPLTIGNADIASGDAPDTSNPSNPVCLCPMPIGYRIGLAIGYWEPFAMVDVTRKPYCLVNMGGIDLHIGKGGDLGGQQYHNEEGSGAFYWVHWYKYPLIYWLNIITSLDCLEKTDFDIRPPAKRFIKHDGLSDSCGILKSCL